MEKEILLCADAEEEDEFGVLVEREILGKHAIKWDDTCAGADEPLFGFKR